MRIIKEFPTIYRSSKYIEPDTKLGIFLKDLTCRLNKEKEFISFISVIKFWDYSKTSLWAFEDILNYIDDILHKYSNANNDDVNKNILLPLLKFLYLLISNNFSKEIFSSFDNLQNIYLTTFDLRVKTIIIEINLLFIENKRSLVHLFKKYYKTFSVFIGLKNILIDLINNNFKINNSIINVLEEILNNIHKKWNYILKQRKRRLSPEEQKSINEISPFNLFKEIINNKKNYRNNESFRDKNKKDYIYFTQGYINKLEIKKKIMTKETVLKYLIDNESEYITTVNNYFCLLNEIVECSNDNKNINKIITITKYILYCLNLYIKDNQNNFDDEIVVSECYIECYYNDILKIVTSPKISIDLKSVFLKSGITFMITFDGYDNILFQNGLFHSFLNDLTHQNGNDMEVLTLKDSNNQEFLNIILNFVFNFSIFKEIPLNFLSKILELPKNNIYPYRLDNVIYSLKKKKLFDENIINQIIMPRLIYELEHINVPSNELKYLFTDHNTHNITINERNILIDRLYKILLRIIQKSTNLNSYGNFDEVLTDTFKKIFADKDILKNDEYTPSIINSIYFFVKLCNSFPSKIINYIKNDVFNVMIDYFTNFFPKYDGAIHLLFLMLYTICIHNDGKKYIKENIPKMKTLFESIFKKLQNDEKYFYYNLFYLRDFNKYELYSPYHALIHMEGVSELIEIIFQNLKNFTEKFKTEIPKYKIEYNEKIQLNKELFFFENKRLFINEFFISFNTKDIELFENTLKIDILPLIKSYFEILLNPISLYCINSSSFSMVNSAIGLAKQEPVYVMDSLYDKFNEILKEKNNLKLHQIQIDKIISTLQKITEFLFGKIYQKTKEKLDIHKYSILFAKLIIDTITTKTNISYYISPVNDRELVINSNYYCKFLSKKIEPQLRNLLIKISYKTFCRDLPHTTNPKLEIIDEDNYKNIKYPFSYNQKFRVEILNDSFFNSELLTIENKIYNYLLTSIDYFCSIGKMIKAKGLYDVKEEDVESVRNFMKLSYILKEMIKHIRTHYVIHEFSSGDEIINNILTYLSLFNMLNILLNGKNGKSISPIVIFYFIKYGGIREILSLAKSILYFCKKEFAKGELPLIELLIIKNFWNLLVSLLLSIVKYSFMSHNGFYIILIREGELIKNFNVHKELDIYVRYLILNDFIEIFFKNDDLDYNISVIQDIEMNSNEFTKGVYILFDTCLRHYQTYIDLNKDDKIKLKEVISKGYKIWEIIQAIQEGKKTCEDIIKHLTECKKIENGENKEESKDEKKEDAKDEKKDEKDINNNMDIDIDTSLNNKDKDKDNNAGSSNANNEMDIQNDDKNDSNKNNSEKKDENKDENNDNKDKENDNNNNNNINNNESNNVNLNNNNNNINHNNNRIIDNNIIRVVIEGFGNENGDSRNKEKEIKKLNAVLNQIEEIPLYPDDNFIKEISNIFTDNNETKSKSKYKMEIEDIQNDRTDNNFSFNKHRNELYPYNKENYVQTLNFLDKIISKCPISYHKVNDIRKMNIDYRIKEFEDKKDLLPYLGELIEQINSNKISNTNIKMTDEEKILKELKCKKVMNYSILRYKTLNKNFYGSINLDAYKEFIDKNKLISNALLSIKELINNAKGNNKNINKKIILKLIYENVLTVYIIFCFLEHFKNNFLEEKKNFLETFLFQLKESYNEQNLSFINEPILILCLQIIIQFFNPKDKSQELLNKFLNDNNLLKYILDLKFSPENANIDFYDNKFKYFVTIDECFKQFIHKIFSEKNLYEHLLQNIFKYLLANLEYENYEIDLDDFNAFCSDFIKMDNNDEYENAIKKLFNIVEKEAKGNNLAGENKKIYILRLKEEFRKEVDSMRNEINKYNHKSKNNDLKLRKRKTSLSLKRKESHLSTKASKKIKVKNILEEKIKKMEKLWSENNKSLFYTLLKHIWKTSTLIGENVTKNQKYSKFARNYIIDLDSSLSALNCILHSFPSYISLLLQFQSGKSHKISFIKYLIKYVFPLLNYYHYCISLPAHIKNNEQLENIILKEKKDVLRNYNNRPNSFQSFFESFRYINIICSLMHSMTYKRRNMNENECLLINECRKKIINEVNLILSDISHQKNNEFNFLQKSDELFPKNVVSYKSCIIVLFSMTEFNENSDIYNQFNPFEISNLVYSKDYQIVKNISIILKQMKIREKNEIFHEMGIKYLSQLFKFIKINQKQSNKEKEKDKKELSNSLNKKEKGKDNNEPKEPKKKDSNMMVENKEEKEKEKNEMEIDDNKDEKKPNLLEDENSIGFLENSGNLGNNDLIIDDLNDDLSENEVEEEEEEEGEEEENEENEDGEDEEDDDDEDEMLPEQILAQSNVEEDLFSLMRTDEDDSLEDNEDLESIHLNNIDLEIIRNNDNINEENNENENGNNFNTESFINRLEVALGMNRQNNNQEEANDDNLVNNNSQNQNYNEENILFYNPFIDSSSNINKSHIKTEINIFYEEFITFPFLILRNKAKNNLIYFDRPNMSIDIFSNLDKTIVSKTSSLFLYYYLFPFDLNFERYFHFGLIGTKENTVSAYYDEINKIVNDFLSMYSIKDISAFENSIKAIKKNLIEDETIPKIKEINENKKENNKNIDEKNQKLNNNENNNVEDLKDEKDLLNIMPEEIRESISKQMLNDDKGNNKIDNNNSKEKKVEDTKNNKNNQIKDEDDKMKENENTNREVKETKEKNNDENNVNETKEKENEKEKEKDNNNDISKNNENNNEIDIQFIMDLPADLREEILLNLDPSMVPHLSPELKNEYNRIINENNVIYYDIPLFDNGNNQNNNNNGNFINNLLNQESGENNEINLFSNDKKELNLRQLKYKREEILSNYNITGEDNNLLLQIFDDDFIESVIVFNIKTILTFRKKNNKSFNEYYELLNELLLNDNMRYKILDLLIDTWICDASCLLNLLKSKKIPDKNNFLKNLYYLYIEENLTEDYFFDDYEHFFINFSSKHQKDMKKYFLKSKYNEKGAYIYYENETKKEYNITENSKNIKELLNVNYKSDENVLSNLISLTLLNSRSNIKTIFSIKIFTSVIQNCLKDITSEETNGDNANDSLIDKNKTNELNINNETIEKIIDLFNTFETPLYLNKGQRSNNPTSLLIEMINDQKIYQILLDVLKKRILSIKETITKEMDDFFKNKKIDIVLFNKLLPEIILFKLVKLLSSINDNFNNQINETEKPNSKKKKDKNTGSIKNNQIKMEMQDKLKKFIKQTNDILFSCWEQLNNLVLGVNNILKDSQDNLLPKLNRLIPYLETFITLSHLQFISTNSTSLNFSEKNPFIFEQKFISGKDSPTRIPFELKPMNSKNEVDSFVEFFYEFCEKNKKVINFILRQYPKMFPNELIIKISSILDLENKQKYFRHCLKKLPSSHKCLEIQVRRNSAELFSDSFAALSYRDAKDLRGKLKVNFENEEAVDLGGVKREWLTLLSKEMFNPNYMLFTLAKNGTTYTINSDSGKYNPEHLRQFEFIGKIMAKAIFDGMMLDCYFTRIIYKLISGTPISYHDMEDYDPVYYNSLKWLLENDFTDQETYLTYSYNHDNLGEIQTVDLIENGRNIEVTESNKFDYIQKLCSSKLYDTIKQQIDALLKGFYEIIPQKLISIFNHRELELVISGLPTIDIKDWKNNTIYENYNEESNIIKYFWEIIESFDNDERAEFLQFVTGSSKVPLEGFSSLQGIGGINKFKISKVFDKNFDRLPTAHTCTNQLDLPDYPNKEILYERLTLAIREGKNSFGFV